MNLESLGYTEEFEQSRHNNNLGQFEIGRVTAEHKERYIVKTGADEYEGEIIGNFRYSAQKRSDFPAVGDWVAISEYDDNKVLIHAVLPRKTVIERQAVGKQGEKQIIATNIDFALILQAVDRDFNVNRIERYLTICNAAKVNPIIILNKIDLIAPEELNEKMQTISDRVPNIPLVAISNETLSGYDDIRPLLEKGKTYCLLGSSGVGKSTLVNNLSGTSAMKTGDISEAAQRGKHVTSHRELFILENGSILIDNPGMREVGITDAPSGMELTFDQITELSQSCRFNDCSHIQEKGCAVLEAVDNGKISHETYDNYLKMEREKSYFESSVAEKRQKDKAFGKMIKGVLKEKRKTKW